MINDATRTDPNHRVTKSLACLELDIKFFDVFMIAITIEVVSKTFD